MTPPRSQLEIVTAFADAVAKGTYIQRIAVTSTMGPGVKVEPGSVLRLTFSGYLYV